jgi:hypothetical protein
MKEREGTGSSGGVVSLRLSEELFLLMLLSVVCSLELEYLLELLLDD